MKLILSSPVESRFRSRRASISHETITAFCGNRIVKRTLLIERFTLCGVYRRASSTRTMAGGSISITYWNMRHLELSKSEMAALLNSISGKFASRIHSR